MNPFEWMFYIEVGALVGLVSGLLLIPFVGD